MTAETLSVRVQYPQEGTTSAVKPASQDGVNAWKKAYEKDRQTHWQKIFQTDGYNLYDRERKPVKWNAFREACYESMTDPVKFIKNFGEHIQKIDYEFRGEKDAGNLKERAERIAVMLGIIGAFTTFDRATSFWIGEKSLFFGKVPRHTDDRARDAGVAAFVKLAEVMNDKYASALANMTVERLSGKRGFVHEVADKGADTLTVAVMEKLEDWVNGPNLEAAQRILFQIPIAGALLEQGFTRLSLLQEKSSIHTATGKMFYMALGTYFFTRRNVKELIAQKNAKK
jgi:hypothetical protein